MTVIILNTFCFARDIFSLFYVFEPRNWMFGSFLLCVRIPDIVAGTLTRREWKILKNNNDGQDIQKYQKVILGLLDLNCSLLAVSQPSDCRPCKKSPLKSKTDFACVSRSHLHRFYAPVCVNNVLVRGQHNHPGGCARRRAPATIAALRLKHAATSPSITSQGH